MKRLLTGVMTLTTLLTALSASQVQAAENQYYTNVPDDAGRVIQIDNNGNEVANLVES